MRQLREALYRVRPLSWQRILEDSRLLMGLLLKIPLIVSDGLTKEVCLGLHYFAKQVVRLGRKSGWLFVSLYLKQCATCLMQYYASDSRRPPEPLSVSISLTRCGLPRIIFPHHRKWIRKRDDRADIIVKIYLSAFTIAKVIRLAKKVSKGTFESMISPAPNPRGVVSFILRVQKSVPELIKRYVPHISTIPLFQGIRWDPTWKATASYMKPVVQRIGNRLVKSRSFFRAFPFEVHFWFEKIKSNDLVGMGSRDPVVRKN